MKKGVFYIIFIVLYLANILFILKTGADIRNIIINIILATIIYLLMCYVSIKLYNSGNKVTNIIFINIVSLIMLQGVINFDFISKENKDENRVLAGFPKNNPFHEDFAEGVDSYINDRIGLRSDAGNMYSYFIKNDYDFTQKVIAGQNGWLFYNSENDDYNYFSGVKTYSENNIEKIVEVIKENQEFCNENGIKLIITIPPNKSTVYPEYYSKYINKKDVNNNYLKLRNIISRNFDISLVMSFESLIESKKEYQLYYKTDTHWNRVGAYIFYKDIANVVKNIDSNFQILNEEEIDIKKIYNKFKGDLTKISNKLDIKRNIEMDYMDVHTKYKQRLLFESKSETITITKGYNYDGPKILFIHDSFFEYMEPFFEYGVSELGSLWVYESDFNKFKEQILNFKPDIIVWERLEKYWYKNGK